MSGRPGPAPAPISVRGGTHGIAVREQHLTALAGRLGAAAHDTGNDALSLHVNLADPEITSAGLFDPAGYAAFETSMLAALDGPFGLSWVAARCGLADVTLRAAVKEYTVTEAAIEQAENALELPAALAFLSLDYARTHSMALSAQHAITTFPGVADALIDELGLLPIVAGQSNSIDDGHGVALRTGTDSSPIERQPPRNLTDVVTALGRRDDDDHHGAIDVRFLTRPDGSRSVIVDISGTKSWTRARTPDITSLVTNGRSLLGEKTSYEQGVLAAMKDAGVTRHDKVMIVGHSEGGMVAVTTARDAVHSGEFDVTHVITAGSPIGLSVGSVPKSVQVLALEGSNDLVPHLDGRSNPDRANVLTVSGAHGDGTITGDHGTDGQYIPLARDTDASTNASVRDFVTSADHYFDATSVDTRTYQVVRHY